LSTAPRTGHTGRIVAATALGAVIGATSSAGNALLLYTGQGFLRAAGLLFASTMLAIAAGVWAGASDEHAPPPRSGARWVMLVLALLLGGGVAILWSAGAELRELALAASLAVLFILAVPAYTAGAVLSALHARQRAQHAGGIAPAALGGAAIGVLITTMLLIQNLEAFAIYEGAAALALLVGMAEARARPLGVDSATGFSGRVAMITGVGGRAQLGFALAQKFLDAGARIIITDTSTAVEELAAELVPTMRVAAVRADLTLDDDVGRLIAAAEERFGRLDALVNADGGAPSAMNENYRLDEQREHDTRHAAAVVLRTCHAALPLLRESRGAIVNFVVSEAASDSSEKQNASSDIVVLTRELARGETGSGVRANAIATRGASDAGVQPAIDAPFTLHDDIAAVALFLAGPAAAAITGETVRVRNTPRP
jgi:3-oxoacyl-[acyl-carrier protein] reductase